MPVKLSYKNDSSTLEEFNRSLHFGPKRKAQPLPRNDPLLTSAVACVGKYPCVATFQIHHSLYTCSRHATGVLMRLRFGTFVVVKVLCRFVCGQVGFLFVVYQGDGITPQVCSLECFCRQCFFSVLLQSVFFVSGLPSREETQNEMCAHPYLTSAYVLFAVVLLAGVAVGGQRRPYARACRYGAPWHAVVVFTSGGVFSRRFTYTHISTASSKNFNDNVYRLPHLTPLTTAFTFCVRDSVLNVYGSCGSISQVLRQFLSRCRNA